MTQLTRLALLALWAAGCGSRGPRGMDGGDRICSMLADRLELRLRSHAADLPNLRSWAAGDGAEKTRRLIAPTLTDFVATGRVVVELGSRCFTPQPACTIPTKLSPLEHPDEALTASRVLLDGMRGHGSCAPVESRVRADLRCDDLGARMVALDGEIDAARTGATPPVDERGLPTPLAVHAAELMAGWRAVIDYGLAAGPLCIPKTHASCARLRDGLGAAMPEDLAARVRALQDAYRRGSACAELGASAASDEAGATR